MLIQRRSAVRRVVGTVAVAAAALGVGVLINPAVASAATTAPEVSYSVDGNDLTLTVRNTNTTITSWCQVFVLNAADAAAVAQEPGKLLDPNVVVYPDVSDPSTLFGVGVGSTVTKTAPDLPDGTYAVVGGCVDFRDGSGLTPTIGTPAVVIIGGPLGGINTGSLTGLFGS
ncbi:hypothetical protein C7T36_10870 [Rhodococcus sp. AD45-ID]|uniref:Uncharacterized protein n=1 Tax=Rhodococcus globerulus TaxID=33008 RepID=A0ABU4BXK3_RHOGO|nr:MULTISPECIES: hypothetical protein [Rhodococcus]KJF24326.1 hypothetical protein SZ00_01247 [Rhodococcus sp. AD45]MDV6268718.1 hypothetical protein [Rhodococcus globerulus]PSR42636.1 hypothetical protein C7T36_10870 [Rhodococcus sp. AD45-ID]